MRIKFFFYFLSIFLGMLVINIKVQAACGDTDWGECSGPCGVQTNTYSGTLGWSDDEHCDPGFCAEYNCYDAGHTCSDPNSPYNWSPVEGVCCDQIQCKPCSQTGGSNCIYETATVVCMCDQPTPTPTGGTRTPTPTLTPPTATPTLTPPTATLITGRIQTDMGAAMSGSFCTQATDSPLNLSGLVLRASNGTNIYSASFGLTNGNYSIDTNFNTGNYTVTLNLANQTGPTDYVCSCPAPIDPNNPYRCRYTGVNSPMGNVNFYLREYNLSNTSWFQVFGSNFFSQGGITSNVPYSFCSTDASCQAALSVPKTGSSNQLASGFPLISLANRNQIKSSPSSSAYRNYLHLATRTSNTNAYSVSSNLNQLSYDYFYNLAESSVTNIGNGQDLEPLFNDWRTSGWWQSGEVNYVKVDGNVSIDESQGFFLNASQKLVVFVDGNLTFDDSNPNDVNRKITSVNSGGLLVFFVKGDIIITPDVGYELNPAAPTVPAVSNANSNLVGVFLADGNLTIQSKVAVGEALPDKKFIGSGTFVGWTNVNLSRTFDDGNLGAILNNNQAIDNFIYRPDFLANWPLKIKASISNWREIDPQLIAP